MHYTALCTTLHCTEYYTADIINVFFYNHNLIHKIKPKNVHKTLQKNIHNKKKLVNILQTPKVTTEQQ